MCIRDSPSYYSGDPALEQRHLYEILGLHDPSLRLVIATSSRVTPEVRDYYLSLLPPSVRTSAKERLTLITADDPSSTPLARKLLGRPKLLAELDKSRGNGRAHLHVYTAGPLERELSLHLGVPLLGTDPALEYWGSKSGGMKLFDEADVPHTDGENHLHTELEVARATVALLERKPMLPGAVVKLNYEAAGRGNAILDLLAIPDVGVGSREERAERIVHALPTMKFIAPGQTWGGFRRRLETIGVRVEELLDGDEITSPSVQGYIGPDGRGRVISTHEQVLGGESNQKYLGARFPAEPVYRRELATMGEAVLHRLAQKGAMGYFGVDTLGVRPRGGKWELKALETNLRLTAAVPPYEATRLLTGADYDPATGHLVQPSGQAKFYLSTEHVNLPGLVGMKPSALLSRPSIADLTFDSSRHTGAFFHMLGPLEAHGRAGFVAIGNSPAEAESIYGTTLTTLAREAGN